LVTIVNDNISDTKTIHGTRKIIVKTTEKDEPIPDVWKKHSENTRAEKRPAGCLCRAPYKPSRSTVSGLGIPPRCNLSYLFQPSPQGKAAETPESTPASLAAPAATAQPESQGCALGGIGANLEDGLSHDGL